MFYFQKVISQYGIILSVAKVKIDLHVKVCNYCVSSQWICVTHRWSQGHILLTTGCHNSDWSYKISNYWKLGVEELNRACQNTHKHILYRRALTLSPHTHSHNSTTAHETSLLRTSCPIARAPHTHTWVGSHLHVHTHTDVELIKRFPEGSQERQATVGIWMNLQLWPEQTHWAHSAN